MRLVTTIETEGATPPIVLLHSLALDRFMWSAVVEELGDSQTVITMDLRGHGGSRSRGSFTVEDMADDVAATLDEMEQPPAVIIGLSMGGCVAQALAIRHPAVVAGLGLVDTTAWYGPDAPERWAERGMNARQRGMASLSQFQLDRWFGSDFLKTNIELCEQLLDVFAANDVDSYVAACHAMGAFDARDGLSTITCPTVVIVGELDAATSPEHASALCAGISGASMHVIAGAKHLTPVECPDEVTALLSPLWTG